MNQNDADGIDKFFQDILDCKDVCSFTPQNSLWQTRTEVPGEQGNCWAPLHHAAMGGKIEAARMLIQKGASIEVLDKVMRLSFLSPPSHSEHSATDCCGFSLFQFGHTPLMMAAHWGQYEMAELLINYGASRSLVNNDGIIPLQCAQQGFKNKWYTDQGTLAKLSDLLLVCPCRSHTSPSSLLPPHPCPPLPPRSLLSVLPSQSVPFLSATFVSPMHVLTLVFYVSFVPIPRRKRISFPNRYNLATWRE